MSKKAIWQSKENKNEYFGHNKDLLAFNKQKGGVLLIEGDKAVHQNAFISNESNIMPSTAPISQQKTKKKKPSTKEKVINVAVRQAESEQPMPMPPVVLQEGQIGYSTSSLIRTKEEDPLKKMRVCGEEFEEEIDEQEEPMSPAPKIVSK